MFKSFIIADDFTGANDTGVQLQRKGYPVNVILKCESTFPSDTSIVLDTESRNLTEEDAYQKVKNAIKNTDFSDYRYVIKKTDSLLRGNIAKEIKAVDEQMHPELIIFMPALPDLERTTVNGVQHLKEIPVSKTEMAHDPVKPVSEDNITRLLQQVYSETVTHIAVSDLQNGDISFSAGRLFSVDAESNQQMQTVITKALHTGKKILFVGTAAIADNIFALEKPVKPSLGLIASVSDVTRTQVFQAEKAKLPIVNVDIPKLMKNELSKDQYIQKALTYLQQSRDVLIISSATYDREELSRTIAVAQKLGMSKEQASEYTQQIMGLIGEKVIQKCDISGLFLAGGDTAIGFFQTSMAEGSEIIGEVAAGIPLMKMVGGKYPGLKVVTKSGAFGNPDAIVYALRKLKE